MANISDSASAALSSTCTTTGWWSSASINSASGSFAGRWPGEGIETEYRSLVARPVALTNIVQPSVVDVAELSGLALVVVASAMVSGQVQ